MKQWNKDDLILFYYGELNEAEDFREALSISLPLQQQYADLSEFLDHHIDSEVPAPNANFNQRIMASIYRQADKEQRAEKGEVQSETNGFLERLLGVSWQKFAGASFAMMFFVGIVFLMGRWSAQPEIIVVDSTPMGQFGIEESQRVLFSNVSSHLEVSGRLLTLVSNEANGVELESRRQHIKDLLAFNRLYRRVVEQSGDKQLAYVLQQMELVLIELNHADRTTESDLSSIKNRLEESDLIYRLKISNKKLNQKITYI